MNGLLTTTQIYTRSSIILDSTPEKSALLIRRQHELVIKEACQERGQRMMKYMIMTLRKITNHLALHSNSLALLDTMTKARAIVIIMKLKRRLMRESVR